MNGGPNGFLNKRQPSMSLMNLHHALTMENPAETRRQHLARLRRNIMVRRSLRTLPHNMVPSAKTRTTFPNTIRSRIIFATAPKCSRRKRSARAHRPRFRARPRKLARLFPINAMKILTGKAINIVIPPIGSDMLTKTPSTPSISDNVLPQANFFIHTKNSCSQVAINNPFRWIFILRCRGCLDTSKRRRNLSGARINQDEWKWRSPSILLLARV